MKRILLIIVLFLLFGVFLCWLPKGTPVIKGVVKLEVTSDCSYGGGWQGTGVFVADDLILTAGHMVKDVNEIWVVWSDGRRHKAISWYQETEADLGIVYIRTPEKESKATFDEAVIGETVWALGNPFGVFPILTKGIISAVNMPDSFTHTKNMIVADCGANAGNSGCPLFDKDGNILGIFSWHYTIPATEGMNYFVRAEICQLVLEKYRTIKALKGIK